MYGRWRGVTLALTLPGYLTLQQDHRQRRRPRKFHGVTQPCPQRHAQLLVWCGEPDSRGGAKPLGWTADAAAAPISGSHLCLAARLCKGAPSFARAWFKETSAITRASATGLCHHARGVGDCHIGGSRLRPRELPLTVRAQRGLHPTHGRRPLRSHTQTRAHACGSSARWLADHGFVSSTRVSTERPPWTGGGGEARAWADAVRVLHASIRRRGSRGHSAPPSPPHPIAASSLRTGVPDTFARAPDVAPVDRHRETSRNIERHRETSGDIERHQETLRKSERFRESEGEHDREVGTGRHEPAGNRRPFIVVVEKGLDEGCSRREQRATAWGSSPGVASKAGKTRGLCVLEEGTAALMRCRGQCGDGKQPGMTLPALIPGKDRRGAGECDFLKQHMFIS